MVSSVETLAFHVVLLLDAHTVILGAPATVSASLGRHRSLVTQGTLASLK